MNSVMRESFPILTMYQALREQLMDILTDEDLQFNLGGDNLSLGELCVEIGETEQSYINSFLNGRFESAVNPLNEAKKDSVAQLVSWYSELDEALRTAVSAFSDEALQEVKIDRGPNFQLPVHTQLMVYQEALLIFYGKVMVYLKAMQKERPQQWQEWIA